jgi:hypothetical protein
VPNIQKEEFFIRKLDLNLRTKLVNFYIWSTACYGDSALRKVDQKYLESIKMWYWKRMEKIS